MNLANKNIIVTGATYGVGKMLSEQLSIMVLICGKNSDRKSERANYSNPYSSRVQPKSEPNRKAMESDERACNNYFFSSAKIFRERIDDFFEKTLPDIADSLDSRINDNFQRLNPAF